MENPYTPALEWIQKHKGTGSAVGIAKLILSLWNDDAAYSFRECVSSFDDTRREWALKVITHFLEYGEDQFLADAGKQVSKLYPELWDKGCAGSAAKREWSRKRDEEFDRKMSQ